MIFALASIDIYRKGESDRHPFGYFTAALRSLNNNMKFESIQDIQGFLLIARFGLYYYIGRYNASVLQALANIYRLFRMGNMSNLFANLHRAWTTSKSTQTPRKFACGANETESVLGMLHS